MVGRKHDYSMLQHFILRLMIIHKQNEVVDVNIRFRHYIQRQNPFTPPSATEIFFSAAGIYPDAIKASPNNNSRVSSPQISQDIIIITKDHL